MTSSAPASTESLGLTEMLRKQLLAYSTSGEIGKITAQAQNIEGVFNGLCLGFRDLAGYDRVMVLGIDSDNFCLKPLHSVGFNEEVLKDFRAEIHFMAGEYADAIFCNKHILADPVPDSDSFSLLGCNSYIVFPLLKRVMEECWKVKNCQRTDCPCYASENQYCWTNLDAGLATEAISEDDRRHKCIKCEQFKCEGLLFMDLTNHAAITGDDVAMMYSIVAHAGLIMESFSTHEALRKANEKLKTIYEELQKAHRLLKVDLQQASLIQQQLLPSSFPKGLSDVFADYKANLEVGGDYYDCFELENGVIALVVADVSGHGTAAAMMMSMFKIMLKSSPLNGISPAQTLKDINKTLVTEIDSGKFITVFYAIWQKDTRKLIYTNAGHNPVPLINKQTGEIELLKSSGLFIGIMPDITIEDKVLNLGGDYRINLYTDGINEAMNSAKEQFGHKRIYDLMRNTINGSCKEFVESLLKKVDDFCEENELIDDATILVCDL
ncbi:MAG: PP2C family protein-serine/threonine phosphatase [Candidatus Fibromonas sp.]|jgi:serine phosphatase RsbU (regulator of sigma subunit)|nr:PP2C family protein-serine/threonine phosphatase [Candidatus Fibromonas sp.]